MFDPITYSLCKRASGGGLPCVELTTDLSEGLIELTAEESAQFEALNGSAGIIKFVFNGATFTVFLISAKNPEVEGVTYIITLDNIGITFFCVEGVWCASVQEGE